MRPEVSGILNAEVSGAWVDRVRARVRARARARVRVRSGLGGRGLGVGELAGEGGCLEARGVRHLEA